MAASSRLLTEQVIAPIPQHGDPVVVELGPGTGAFTAAIQQRLNSRGTHLAVELNPRLASTLSSRYPHIEVICGDAIELPAMLAERNLVADVVISGLPWSAYPVTTPSLPETIASALRPEGAFTQFTYTWSRWAPPARRQQRWLREAFEEVVLSRTIWRNLPPALVYLARRPQTTGADRCGAHEKWDVPSDERRHLARELHDWVGSGVSLALRQLDLYAIGQARNDPAAERRLIDARRTLEELLDCLGRLVSELREERFVTSLETALEDFVAGANLLAVATTVQIRGDETQLPPQVRDELFLVVREALRNAFAHARAGHIDVTVDITSEYVRARVEDDGVGLDARRTESPGSGIASMQERISLLGGSISIAARRPSGTRVDVLIDLLRRAWTDDRN